MNLDNWLVAARTLKLSRPGWAPGVPTPTVTCPNEAVDVNEPLIFPPISILPSESITV